MALTGITSASNITSRLADVDIEVHSKEIQMNAQPQMYWDQIAIEKKDLKKTKGQTITFLKVNDLDEGDEYDEGQRIVVGDMSTGNVKVTVKEVAKGLSLTELLQDSSPYDLLEILEVLFGDNYAKTINLLWVKEIFQNVPNYLFGHDKPNRAALSESDIFTTDIMLMLHEDMATRNVPKNTSGVPGIDSAFYLFHHPHVGTQIKKDPNFVRAKEYAKPSDLLNGEEGEYDGSRLIKTNYIPVIKHPGTYIPSGGSTPVTPASNVGHVFINNKNFTDLKPLMFPAQTIVPGQVIYQSIIVGARAFAKAIAKEVQIRNNGVIDFGREDEIAWLEVSGRKTLNPDRATIIETVRSGGIG